MILTYALTRLPVVTSTQIERRRNQVVWLMKTLWSITTAMLLLLSRNLVDGCTDKKFIVVTTGSKLLYKQVVIGLASE